MWKISQEGRVLVQSNFPLDHPSVHANYNSRRQWCNENKLILTLGCVWQFHIDDQQAGSKGSKPKFCSSFSLGILINAIHLGERGNMAALWINDINLSVNLSESQCQRKWWRNQKWRFYSCQPHCNIHPAVILLYHNPDKIWQLLFFL